MSDTRIIKAMQASKNIKKIITARIKSEQDEEKIKELLFIQIRLK